MFDGERVVDAVGLRGSGTILDISMTQVMLRMDQNGHNGESGGKMKNGRCSPRPGCIPRQPCCGPRHLPACGHAVGLMVLQPSCAGRRSGGCCHQGALNKGDQ